MIALTPKGVCDCGNEDILNPKSCCSKHGKAYGKEEPWDSQSEEGKTFVCEMKMLFYLFLRVKNVKSEVMDTHRKVEIIGSCLMEKLRNFVKDSYESQKLVARLLLETFGKDYPPLRHD